MDDCSDVALIQRTLAGEANAFGQLVSRYQRSVFNVCFRMMGGQQAAEDMTQEAFLRAYERLHTFDCDRAFGPWIRTVAVNHCLNQLQRKRFRLVPLDEVGQMASPSERQNPLVRALQAEESAWVHQGLQQLAPLDRAIVVMRHFYGFSYRELAETLNLSDSAVKTRLFRARRALEKILSQS